MVKVIFRKLPCCVWVSEEKSNQHAEIHNIISWRWIESFVFSSND